MNQATKTLNKMGQLNSLQSTPRQKPFDFCVTKQTESAFSDIEAVNAYLQTNEDSRKVIGPQTQKACKKKKHFPNEMTTYQYKQNSTKKVGIHKGDPLRMSTLQTVQSDDEEEESVVMKNRRVSIRHIERGRYKIKPKTMNHLSQNTNQVPYPISIDSMIA